MMENLLIDNERMIAVEENYKRLNEQISEATEKSGRSLDAVRFMAVTKTVEPAYINRAIELGIDLIGENRVQEFMGKREMLNLGGVEKHLIGHLQTNKVKQIVGQVDMIESVSSIKLANEISKASNAFGIVTPVLIEVNIGNEASKSGMLVETLEENLCEISSFTGISVQGLMTIPPICENSAEIRKYFSNMYKTFIDISSKKLDNICMKILSMGMSGDFTEAILEGATLVRIGSSLFGARQYK